MAISTDPYALVVDDDARVRIDAAQILEEAGVRCLDVETGDEARALLECSGEQIVLLFTDVQMPGALDGFGLARWAAESWPEIEIVVASGGVTPSPGDMPERATFISKPFDANTVHDHLVKALPDGKKPEPLKMAV